MGFYNTNTVEEKRVNKLTGDIHINDAFKEVSVYVENDATVAAIAEYKFGSMKDKIKEKKNRTY